MEIRQLRAFAAIAEAGTFTAGAQRVHITQAAISMQIRQLETEVGAPLFIRAPRRVLLTEAGEALLERVRRILREHDAALAEIAELAGAERGRLRIGSASAMVSADPLPRILGELRELHPKAEVTIISGTSQELVSHILAGDLDMAFVSLPVEAHGIQTEVLSRDELVAIASPSHKLAKERVVSIFTLAGEKLILGESGGNTRRLIDGLFEEAGVRPVVAMELSRQAAIKRMVEENMGVGIIPQGSVREEVAQGRLVSWWIEGAHINWELGLAKLAGDYDPPICQTFTRLCRKFFGSDGLQSPEQQKHEPEKRGRKAKRPAEKRRRGAGAK